MESLSSESKSIALDILEDRESWGTCPHDSAEQIKTKGECVNWRIPFTLS